MDLIASTNEQADRSKDGIPFVPQFYCYKVHDCPEVEINGLPAQRVKVTCDFD
ncbi:MAG: hypothetical protein F6K24_31310 [Okeania sp. SIO2D1]|nr:hypothetical protein [Okeania sp. SIO2D1]